MVFDRPADVSDVLEDGAGSPTDELKQVGRPLEEAAHSWKIFFSITRIIEFLT